MIIAPARKMASLDLDPVFVKALKLLHSKSKDSGAILKQMLDDAIAQRKGQHKSKTSSESERSSEKNSSKHSSNAKRDDDSSIKKREAEKRHVDQTKQAGSESSPEVPIKKTRLENADSQREKEIKDKHTEKDREKDREREKSKKDKDKDKEREKERRERKEKEREKEKEKEKEREKKKAQEQEKEKERLKMKEREEEKQIAKKVEEASSDEELDRSMDADDFAIGLGLSCVVCKQLNLSSGNQLVECQECHSLYHQECHRPPVVEQDVNDPRFVWYCSRCEKTMKKQVTKPLKSKSTVVSIPEKSEKPALKISKTEPANVFAFNRREARMSSSSSKDIASTGAAKPLSGLASLAANLSGSKSSSTKTDQSKSSSTKSDQSKSSNPKSEQSKSTSSKTDQSRSSSLSSSKTSDQSKSSSSRSDQSKTSTSMVSDTPEKANLSKEKEKDKGKSDTKPLQRSSVDSKTDTTKLFSGKSADSGKMTKSSSSSLLSSKSSSQGGQSAVVSADKRLQLMKKKAAAKLTEKRSSMK